MYKILLSRKLEKVENLNTVRNQKKYEIGKRRKSKEVGNQKKKEI